MPSLLTSTARFTASAEGVAVKAWLTQLPAGALDRIVMEASDEVIRFCGRRLLMAPVTTLTAPANPGASTLSVTDATNIYMDDVVQMPDGSVLEITGADVTAATPDANGHYAGTIYLNDTVSVAAATGATVTMYRQERVEMTGKGSADVDLAVPITQAAQLALAHAPHLPEANARRIMLGQYPLWRILAAYVTLPWSNSETTVDLSGLVIQREIGQFRLPVASYNPLGSIWRVQYQAGHQVVPDAVRQATHFLAADQVAQQQNSLGAHQVRNDGQYALMTRHSQAPNTRLPQSVWRETAYQILIDGGFRRNGV